MSNNFYMEKPASNDNLRFDHIFVISVILLTGIGLVTLYSASSAFAERFFHNRLYFIYRQVVYAFLGFVFFAAAAYFPLSKIRSLIMPLVLITMLLCVLSFLPIVGVTKNGAARWIRIGKWTYQPSELVKLVLPLYLAHIFDRKKDNLDKIQGGILAPLIITIVFFSLIYLQNNFSTATLIVVSALLIFFASGVKLSFFISAAIILCPILFLLVFTKEHRLRRVLSFIWKDWEPLGAGFQVHESIKTIQAGGFWGKGIGQGTRKIASVPEIQSDFIFASFAEEAGFLGVILFTLLLAIFFLRVLHSSFTTDDMFKKLLAMGLGTEILIQTMINVFVVSGTIPNTGLPLPFFSAGGSSLLTTLIMAGLIANTGRREAVIKK